MSVARASVARMRAHDVPPASDAPRRYADGETITHQGDRPAAPGRVIAGTARIAILAEDGREAVVALIGPGAVFDECALLGEDSAVGVRAVGATSIVRITEQDACAGLARRVVDATLLLEESLLRDVRGRLERRLASLEARGDVAVTQEELGRMVGAARETVNRALRDLAATRPSPRGRRRRVRGP